MSRHVKVNCRSLRVDDPKVKKKDLPGHPPSLYAICKACKALHVLGLRPVHEIHLGDIGYRVQEVTNGRVRIRLKQ
jgi:hypothetical protein